MIQIEPIVPLPSMENAIQDRRAIMLQEMNDHLNKAHEIKKMLRKIDKMIKESNDLVKMFNDMSGVNPDLVGPA